MFKDRTLNPDEINPYEGIIVPARDSGYNWSYGYWSMYESGD